MATGTCCYQTGAFCDCAKDVRKSAEEERGSNGSDGSECPPLCVTTVDVGPPSLFKTFPSDSGPICRICHEGGSMETLLSPCDCTGTLATVHRSCLELWLSSSNTNYCELCHKHFTVQRRLRSFKQWLHDPGTKEERRLVFCDIMCFLFVTPLASISGWLCLKGVKDDLQLGSLLQNTGLISLTLVLFSIYTLWTMVCLRYHCKLYSEWRRKDQQVHLLIPKTKEAASSQNPLQSPLPRNTLSPETLV
ncbi:E3 ubiquitin-protein ligase MARCHF2-like [Corythoichthys intestinalis]|uniref:E3 ubiquitin-protein ligase MARCHF2-like n=1 Tax=Corythoichthys intestinalis TaxID=161448 RepID=UPI0025A60EDD|nr:E3 ubiquitin-protein ligase MARCHF2-like [Corythoichthys intestinalis]XP_061790605.1 E3 ubiquitin-protein ligase MARCHF2-like [Nerophis lumbriciformis]